MLIACAAALGPVLWYALASMRTPEELARVPVEVLPSNLTLQNYSELFVRRPFGTYYINSFVIASLAALLCIAAAAPAAYRLARSRGRLRSAALAGLLALAFFPPIALVFPIYELVRWAGLVNHPWGLIIPYAALNLPFAIWLLTGYFGQIPYELEEAAAIDGLNRFETFRRIVLPLGAPALTTAFLLVFIFAWNEFMFALTFMTLEASRTVTVGIATLSGAFTYEIPWGLLAAGLVVSTAPLILAAIFFQKRIVSGLTAGALKQ